MLCDNYFTVSNPADGVSLNARTLFRRFSSDDTKMSGNGLGLSIVKAICDYHDWRVEYAFKENRHVFTVHFR
ncbi:ATP-binding protein [Bacteroides cellulosilyticus]|uniref:ATP-binding protein n=1 Tax=Bacteroides cellulosilyticus TaxID=246787 RepID=UPI0034CEEDE9